MAFNLRLLRVFLAVARRSNFTRAAEELGLSQPAVSRAVRELEVQVGGHAPGADAGRRPAD